MCWTNASLLLPGTGIGTRHFGIQIHECADQPWQHFRQHMGCTLRKWTKRQWVAQFLRIWCHLATEERAGQRQASTTTDCSIFQCISRTHFPNFKKKCAHKLHIYILTSGAVKQHVFKRLQIRVSGSIQKGSIAPMVPVAWFQIHCATYRKGLLCACVSFLSLKWQQDTTRWGGSMSPALHTEWQHNLDQPISFSTSHWGTQFRRTVQIILKLYGQFHNGNADKILLPALTQSYWIRCQNCTPPDLRASHSQLCTQKQQKRYKHSAVPFSRLPNEVNTEPVSHMLSMARYFPDTCTAIG